MTEDSHSTHLLLDALRGVLTQVAEPFVVLRTILDQAVTRTGAERGLLVEVSSGGERRVRTDVERRRRVRGRSW